MCNVAACATIHGRISAPDCWSVCIVAVQYILVVLQWIVVVCVLLQCIVVVFVLLQCIVVVCVLLQCVVVVCVLLQCIVVVCVLLQCIVKVCVLLQCIVVACLLLQHCVWWQYVHYCGMCCSARNHQHTPPCCIDHGEEGGVGRRGRGLWDGARVDAPNFSMARYIYRYIYIYIYINIYT